MKLPCHSDYFRAWSGNFENEYKSIATILFLFENLRITGKSSVNVLSIKSHFRKKHLKNSENKDEYLTTSSCIFNDFARNMKCAYSNFVYLCVTFYGK